VADARCTPPTQKSAQSEKESKWPLIAESKIAIAPRSPVILSVKLLELPAVLSHIADTAADSEHVIDAALKWIRGESFRPRMRFDRRFCILR
jgi:hypothetical protein